MKDHFPMQSTAATVADMNNTDRYLTAPCCADAARGSYFSSRFFSYGLSQQGSSHIERGVPCQDANGMRIVQKRRGQYLIAAAADGLGSCVLSHEGSQTAVQTAISHCVAGLQRYAAPTDQEILELLRQSFSLAWDSIEARAMEMNQLPFSYYTTLTVTVYDGAKLHIGHIGDGGVVALDTSGTISLVTKRHKGESASSVYPLQSGEANWQFLTVEKPVAGYAVATDGVLDSFVRYESYANLVYEPFVTGFLFNGIDSKWRVVDAFNEMDEFLRSPEYRNLVSDDITLLIVGNTGMLYGKKPPAFDLVGWDARARGEEACKQEQQKQPQQTSTKKHTVRRPFRMLKKVYDYFAGSFIRKKKYRNCEEPVKTKDRKMKEREHDGTASGKKRKGL